MKELQKLLLLLITNWLADKFVVRAKKRALKFYIKTLKVARSSLMGALTVLFLFQMMVLGLFTSIFAGIYLMPIEADIKAWIYVGTGIGCFFVPLFALFFMFSEKTWMRVSGADEMLRDLK